MTERIAAAVAALLDRTLAEGGVRAGARRAIAFAQTLVALAPERERDFYWTARVAMLPGIDDAERFELAYARFARMMARDGLDQLVDRIDAPPHREQPQPEARERPSPPGDERADPQDAEEAEVFVAMLSSDERLRTRDLAEMDAAERAAAMRAIEGLKLSFETRESRRRKRDASGDRLDLRATMRGAGRTAGELIRRERSTRRRRPRPLVFLIDVSGSMGPYARALLLYARAGVLARKRVRVFAFATRLTEVTALLRRSIGDPMDALGRELVDYGGGTRIGKALAEFNTRFAQRGAARGGTVAILSDGWEREDPELVAREMERLRLLARRIVWVNPQKKSEAFEPLARGMAAALPYCDDLIAGHNLHALGGVAEALQGATSARKGKR